MLSERPRFVTTATVLATVVAIVAGLAQGAYRASDGQGLTTAALAAVVLTIATAGMRWAESQPGTRALRGMLAAQGAVVVLVVLQTGGKAFVMAMPLVSMLVLYLRFGAALLGVAALTTLFGLLLARSFGIELVVSGLLQIVAAESFVVVFSLVLRRERYARVEVERLQHAVAELAVASERGRVARDLHDSLGHYLTVMSIQLEALSAPGAPQAPRLGRLRELVREALLELRRTVSTLRDAPELGLRERLERLVAEHDSEELRVSLTMTGPARETTPEVGTALFRALQEALTNVRRHARARHTRVTLSYLPGALRLDVVDDGAGAAAGAGVAGHGLRGMRERVSELGGSVEAGPTPSGGFQVRVELPSGS